MQIRSASYNQIQQVSASLLAWGLQPAWVIDPLTGSDLGNGDASSPLKTMGEFNARLSGNFVQVAATLQLVGDVLDAPLQLSGTRFGLSASLNIFGTTTSIATATVTVVAGLGPTAAVFPWQLTTTGINWTTIPLDSQLRFNTGEICFISDVIDANNVVVGVVSNPAGGTITPIATSTITVSTLSRALPLNCNCIGAGPMSTPQLVAQNLRFDTPAAFNAFGGVNQWTLVGGLSTMLIGCAIAWSTSGQFYVGCPFSTRACKLTISANFSWRTALDNPGHSGFLVAGTGASGYNHGLGWTQYTSGTVVTGARFLVTGANVTLSTLHIRKTAGPMLIQNNGTVTSTGSLASPNSGPALATSGNTGIGVDCTDGRLAYFASTKPTVTGASDARVGGVAKTWAQIPFVNYTLNAIPPTVNTLTGNGACIVQN